MSDEELIRKLRGEASHWTFPRGGAGGHNVKTLLTDAAAALEAKVQPAINREDLIDFFVLGGYSSPALTADELLRFLGATGEDK